jgi:hypothetical protein
MRSASTVNILPTIWTMDNATETVADTKLGNVPTKPTVPMLEEAYLSWALFILCTLLVGVLWLSYYFQSRRVKLLHETVVAILVGKSFQS